MSKPQKKPSYASLVWRVLKESPEPLTVREIFGRVNGIRPVETGSPLETIRHAVVQCRLIAHTGGGRYGWYPRLIDGSRVRVPLIDSDLKAGRIVFDDEVRDLLWPGFFAIRSLGDRDPVHVAVADNGKPMTWPLEFYGQGVWGIVKSPEFSKWLKAGKARGGDDLVVHAVDVDARRYRVSLDPQSSRDETAVRRRTEIVEQAAREYVWNRMIRGGCAVWDLAQHLLATGLYRDPVPPEPISPIWRRALLQCETIASSGRRRWKLKGSAANVYQLRIALKGSAPPIWRRVLIPDNATLEDLHWVIQVSMGWTDSHLHLFKVGGGFYSDRSFDWDDHDEKPGDESRITLKKAFKGEEGRQFAYDYDFGDDWAHEIEIERILSAAEVDSYPKCIDGARACPPEDCGGIWGYRDFLDAIGDSSNPERAELLEWAGGAFDPERCDLTAINWRLEKLAR